MAAAPPARAACYGAILPQCCGAGRRGCPARSLVRAPRRRELSCAFEMLLAERNVNHCGLCQTVGTGAGSDWTADFRKAGQLLAARLVIGGHHEGAAGDWRRVGLIGTARPPSRVGELFASRGGTKIFCWVGARGGGSCCYGNGSGRGLSSWQRGAGGACRHGNGERARPAVAWALMRDGRTLWSR